MEKNKLTQPDKTDASNNPEVYPGYPTERLIMQDISNLTLPDGPWATKIATPLPSMSEQKKLAKQGYQLDDIGRPLHPWLRDMVVNPDVGVVTGKGEYWHWGPNRTADPIVMNDDQIPKILLIKRGDTDTWALPGGFIDDNESAEHAARRELLEETGLLLVGQEGRKVYDGAVADLRTTAHAWPETTALAWTVEGTPPVRAGDDASDVNWFSVDELPIKLHGSHADLIEQALADRQTLSTKNHTVSLPFEVMSYTYADGGHMAYHHLRATTSSGKDVFVKSHDKHAFSDPVREAHSKQYLSKEIHLYEHLRRNNFVAIPDSAHLESDHTLVLSAHNHDAGWHWKAPMTDTQRYLHDVMVAASTLQSIPQPVDYRDTLLSTFDTHTREGWGSVDDSVIQNFTKKMNVWKKEMQPDFQQMSDALISDIPTLRSDFQLLSPPTRYVLAHHDFRQANVAWHPDHGAKIVDWSWAGVGRENSDTTTLLIDLHKSGHDVSMWMDRFNQDHALTLIGFWIAHSLWPTREVDSSVRFHQVVSAISAYDLMANYRNKGDTAQSRLRPRN